MWQDIGLDGPSWITGQGAALTAQRSDVPEQSGVGLDKNQVHSASYCCISETVKGHRRHERGSNEVAQRCAVISANRREKVKLR